MKDFLEKYASIIPYAQSAALESALADENSGLTDSAKVRELLTEITSEPQTLVTSVGEYADPDLVNKNIAALYADLTGVYSETNLLAKVESTISNLDFGELAAIERKVDDLANKLELYEKSSNASLDYTVRKYETFYDKTNMENDPKFYGSLREAYISQTDKAAKLSKLASFSRTISKYGNKLAQVSIDKRLGNPIDTRFGVENVIDGRDDTFWAESILTKVPINSKSDWIPESYEGGAAVRIKVEFEHPTQVAELTIKDISSHPMQILGVYYNPTGDSDTPASGTYQTDDAMYTIPDSELFKEPETNYITSFGMIKEFDESDTTQGAVTMSFTPREDFWQGPAVTSVEEARDSAFFKLSTYAPSYTPLHRDVAYLLFKDLPRVNLNGDVIYKTYQAGPFKSIKEVDTVLPKYLISATLTLPAWQSVWNFNSNVGVGLVNAAWSDITGLTDFGGTGGDFGIYTDIGECSGASPVPKSMVQRYFAPASGIVDAGVPTAGENGSVSVDVTKLAQELVFNLARDYPGFKLRQFSKDGDGLTGKATWAPWDNGSGGSIGAEGTLYCSKDYPTDSKPKLSLTFSSTPPVTGSDSNSSTTIALASKLIGNATNGNITINFGTRTMKTCWIVLAQPNYDIRSYKIKKSELKNNELWNKLQSVNYNVAVGVEVNKTSDYIETSETSIIEDYATKISVTSDDYATYPNSKITEYAKKVGGKLLALLTKLSKEAVESDEMVDVTGYEYTYGAWEIDLAYTEYENTGRFVSKPIRSFGEIRSVQLIPTTILAPGTGINYTITARADDLSAAGMLTKAGLAVTFGATVESAKADIKVAAERIFETYKGTDSQGRITLSYIPYTNMEKILSLDAYQTSGSSFDPNAEKHYYISSGTVFAIDGYRPIDGVTLTFTNGVVARPDTVGPSYSLQPVRSAEVLTTAESTVIRTSTTSGITNTSTATETTTRVRYVTSHKNIAVGARGASLELFYYSTVPTTAAASGTIGSSIPIDQYKVVDEQQGVIELLGPIPADYNSIYAVYFYWPTQRELLATRFAGVTLDQSTITSLTSGESIQARPVTRNKTDYLHGSIPTLKPYNGDSASAGYYPVYEYYQSGPYLIFASPMMEMGDNPAEIYIEYQSLKIEPRIILDLYRDSSCQPTQTPVCYDYAALINMRI